MKKFAISFFAASVLLLSGCYENTEEITLNEDGSGILTNTNDMSTLMGLVKQMGSAGEIDKLGDVPVDTTISLGARADSIPNLTEEEKEMVRKGMLQLNMNLKEEKFVTGLIFPFKSPGQITAFNRLSNKVMGETMKQQLGNGSAMGAEGMPEMPEPTYMDDYFTTTFSAGVVQKVLNKEKYAAVADDEYMKSMKEAGTMGLTMSSTLVINLPHPASKVEGKNVKLSEDKKKITVKADIDDFFDDPSKLEFRIEY